jgi:hypothetical protein
MIDARAIQPRTEAVQAADSAGQTTVSSPTLYPPLFESQNPDPRISAVDHQRFVLQLLASKSRYKYGNIVSKALDNISRIFFALSM